MMMVGRKYEQANSKYRYSINGQEKDSELNENITTALYWEYDSRIGRRWNLDPKPNVSISPYNCFGSNPILFSDPNGDVIVVGQNSKGSKKYIKKSKNAYLRDLKNKTGLDLIINKEGKLESKGILTNEGISETARQELLNAIKDPTQIAVDFFSDKFKGSYVDPENDKQIYINTKQYAFPSSDLNKTTMGFALTFFHELFHTPLHNNFKHSGDGTTIDDPDIFTNRIRAELTISQKSDYGQRLAYSVVSTSLFGGKKFIPMSISAKDIYDRLKNLWNIYFDRKSTSEQRQNALNKISKIKVPTKGIIIVK